MLYTTSDTLHWEFATYNSSGALANADSTPTVILVANGTDTDDAVTVTNPSTGRYKVSVALSGRSIGQSVYLVATATVGGVTQRLTTAATPARICNSNLVALLTQAYNGTGTRLRLDGLDIVRDTSGYGVSDSAINVRAGETSYAGNGVNVYGYGDGVNVYGDNGNGVNVYGYGNGVNVYGYGNGVNVYGNGNGVYVSGNYGDGVYVSGYGNGVYVSGNYGDGVSVSSGYGDGVSVSSGYGDGVSVSSDNGTGVNVYGTTALGSLSVEGSPVITSGTGSNQLSVSGGRANADVQQWNGTSVANLTTGGFVQADVQRWRGSAPLSVDATGYVRATVVGRTATVTNPTGTTISLSGGNASNTPFVGGLAVFSRAGQQPVYRRIIDGSPDTGDAVTLDQSVSLSGDWTVWLMQLPLPEGTSAASVADAVWSAGTRTLTQSIPSAADNAATLLTTTNGTDTVGTQLQRLDAAVSSRATPGDVTVTVTPSVIAIPVATSVTQPPLTTLGPDRPRHLSIYQNAAAVFPFNAVDANGESIDLTGKTLRFICCTTSGAVLFVRESGDGVSYADGTISVSITAAETASVADAMYRLWNVTDRQVLGAGRFEIRLAPIDAPE